MIILDLSQVMIANFMAQVGNHAGEQFEENLFRHMVLNSIRSYKVKFGLTYGEIVIACDDKKTWRRDVFPQYKGNRKKARDESDIDWSAIFNTLNKVKDELRDNFDYRVLHVEGAEADDIIGTLVHEFDYRFLILSGDKDFRQLQRYPRVEQFDPIRKKYIYESHPFNQLKEHILRGDPGDGIPNVLSPDNCLVDSIRQKPVSKKKLETWIQFDIDQLENNPDIGVNFRRNRRLIDLTCTPGDIKSKIIDAFYQQANKPRDKMFNYMINNKMKQLIEHIHEF